MRDPYSVLGVDKKASRQEIKTAFRKLAKQYHPDIVGDSTVMAATFQEINQAYDIVGDAEKREKFDNGDIRADGSMSPKARAKAESARPHKSAADAWAAKARSGNRKNTHQDTDEEFKAHSWGKGGESGWSESGDASQKAKTKTDDVFNDLFQNLRGKAEDVKGKAEKVLEEREKERQRAEAERLEREIEEAKEAEKARKAAQPPEDAHYNLSISFEDAARGTSRRVKLPNGKRLDVRIPAGVKPGQQIRLKGQGKSGGENAGDALIEISVEPHSQFTYEGEDVYLTLPVSVDEAVLGAKVMVPTLDGPVAMKIPAGSNADTTLRLKGRGLPRSGQEGQEPPEAFGDQYVVLKIVLPGADDRDFAEAIRQWADANAYEVRAKFGT